MRKYEVVCVFRPEYDNFAKGKTFVMEEFSKAGATLIKEEDMGSRDLAYPIKKQTRGHYYLFELSVDPLKIADMDRAFRLNQELIKYLFIKLDE